MIREIWTTSILVAMSHAAVGLPLHAAQERADDSIEARVERLVRPLVEAHDLAGSILIARATDTVFLASYGQAVYGHGVPNRPDTPMRIGSISKQFTAAAVLLLEEEGALSVTDPLSRFLPEFPRGDEITLHHLLAHQSGAVRDVYTDWRDRRDARSTSEVVEEIAGHPLTFEPGSRTSYSNAGYTLLAAVVERASGLALADFLERRVFGPLGMRRTRAWDPREVIPGLAEGYDPGPPPARLVRTPEEHPSNILGAGGIVSTVGDLHVWSEALESDALLSDQSRARMLGSHGGGRGYGVGVSTDGLRVGHDGITHGFIAFVDRDLSTDLTIVFTGNIRSGVLEGVRDALSHIARGEPYEPVTPPELSPAPGGVEADRLVGTYELFPGFEIEISRDGDRLHLSGTGGYPTVLEPLADGSWFYRARYETIRFEWEGDRVTGLVWIDRAGETYPAPRLPEAR